MIEVNPSSTSIVAERSTSLQKDILRTLLYFDIFHHPLTVKEIYSFLPSNSTTQAAVEQACSNGPLQGLVVRDGTYVRLRDAQENVFADRRSKESRAKRMLQIATLMSRLIRRFPFVRGVFLSGELSKGVASEHSDIDFVIVAAEGRLWICRTFLILFKKIFLFNKKRFFCLNHFVTAGHLEAEDRSVYTATEIATLRPLFNYELFKRYQHANEWIKEYLPNASAVAQDSFHKENDTSFLQRFLEALIPPFVADRLDPRLLSYWKTMWRRRYPELTDDQRSRLFRSSFYLSTAYGQDFLTQILKSYRNRLEQFRLLPTDRGHSN